MFTYLLELCESRGGHPVLPVPNSPYGLCGHKATLNWNRTVSVCLGSTLIPSVTSLDQCIVLLQVDKKVITAIAEGKADPDARLLKVRVLFSYTD